MLLLNSSVVGICIRGGLGLDSARHLLTELTPIRILRHLVLLSLATFLVELGVLVPCAL